VAGAWALERMRLRVPHRWGLALACAFVSEPTPLPARSAGSTFELFRSTDAGRSWTRAGQGLPASLRVDALGQVGATRLAGTERGVFVSKDDGHSWRRPERGLPDDVKVLAFAASAERAYCATARGVFRAGVDGLSWEAVGNLEDVKVLSLVASGGKVFAGTDERGVFVLDDGTERFEPLGEGFPLGAQVFGLAIRDGSLFAALYARGIYRHDAASNRWQPAGEEWPLRLVTAGGTLLSGRNPGGVFASRDGGEHWHESSAGLPHRAPVWMMAETHGTAFLGTTGRVGLFRSDDNGALWTPSDQGLPPGADAITFGAGGTSVLVVVIRSSGGADERINE
jgi:photosystem II stability/assembly factor-like uncharacterized protein